MRPYLYAYCSELGRGAIQTCTMPRDSSVGVHKPAPSGRSARLTMTETPSNRAGQNKMLQLMQTLQQQAPEEVSTTEAPNFKSSDALAGLLQSKDGKVSSDLFDSVDFSKFIKSTQSKDFKSTTSTSAPGPSFLASLTSFNSLSGKSNKAPSSSSTTTTSTATAGASTAAAPAPSFLSSLSGNFFNSESWKKSLQGNHVDIDYQKLMQAPSMDSASQFWDIFRSHSGIKHPATPVEPPVPATTSATTKKPAASPSKKARRGKRKLDHATITTYVTELRDQDVLLGRGGRTNHWPGNHQYLQEKLKIQDRYLKAFKEEKTAISQELVDAIHATGGRFVKLDTETDKWYEVDNVTARKKASQTLREINTPEVRLAKRQKYNKK